MAQPQLSAAEAAKMQLMQDLEIEMMSDLYNRMTQACHKKCVPPRYSEAELGKSMPTALWSRKFMFVNNDFPTFGCS